MSLSLPTDDTKACVQMLSSVHVPVHVNVHCTLYIVHVMKNARRRWNAISRAQAIAGWWGPIGILSVPNLTLAQLKDSGHIWHHILQKYSNSYWKLAFGSSWISALVVYFWPILCNEQNGCEMYVKCAIVFTELHSPDLAWDSSMCDFDQSPCMAGKL